MDELMQVTVQGDTFTEDEIAAVHVNPVTRGYWIILSHYSFMHGDHKAEEYHVNPGDPEYPAMDELYKKMYTVTADEEDSEVVYFRSRHYEPLETLYNYLEKNNYAFTFQLGATRDNYLRVFRDQRKLRPNMRKSWMARLIKEYTTFKPEEE